MKYKRLTAAASVLLIILSCICLNWFINRGYDDMRYYASLIDYQNSLKKSGIVVTDKKVYLAKDNNLFVITGDKIEKENINEFELNDENTHCFEYEGKLYSVEKNTLFSLKDEPAKEKYLGKNIEGEFISDGYLYYASGAEKSRVRSTISGPVRYLYKKYQYNRINLETYDIENIRRTEYEQKYDWLDKNIRYDNKSFSIYKDVSELLNCDSIDLPFIKQYQIQDEITYILFEQEKGIPNQTGTKEALYTMDKNSNKFERKIYDLPEAVEGFAVEDNKLYINTSQNLCVYDIPGGDKKEIDLNKLTLEKLE